MDLSILDNFNPISNYSKLHRTFMVRCALRILRDGDALLMESIRAAEHAIRDLRGAHEEMRLVSNRCWGMLHPMKYDGLETDPMRCRIHLSNCLVFDESISQDAHELVTFFVDMYVCAGGDLDHLASIFESVYLAAR